MVEPRKPSDLIRVVAAANQAKIIRLTSLYGSVLSDLQSDGRIELDLCVENGPARGIVGDQRRFPRMDGLQFVHVEKRDVDRTRR
jgi:hypothetical protein